MKVLSPSAQGTLDYLLIAVLAMAPTALSFTGVYGVVCYLLAAVYLLVVLATDFDMGAVRLLPYRALGGLEVISGLAFGSSPFLFGFARANPSARAFFIGFGGALLVLWALTDWTGKAHSEMSDHPEDNLEGNKT
ncbi:hypothetical protein [uncultured Hymenobacter sp.]|uniref:hypothetical protein n=1 Tax=uncultured Hymenobacter sp. TaxID=170016 RepID=UPI0035CC3A06